MRAKLDGEDRLDVQHARDAIDRAILRMNELDVADMQLKREIDRARDHLQDIIVRNR